MHRSLQKDNFSNIKCVLACWSPKIEMLEKMSSFVFKKYMKPSLL